MKICVVSPSFPTSKTIDFVFVDQLCRAFADLEHEVTVIAPQSVTKCLFRHIPIAPSHSHYKTAKGAKIELYRPYMVSLSNSRFAKLFKNSFQNAVKRAFRKIKSKPDVCYGHFWCSIFSLYPLSRANGIALFGASGEENVSLYVHKTEEYRREIREYISGVVSVSGKNQQECQELNLVKPEKSVVIPNAVDLTLFQPKDKHECRNALGIVDDDFVVAFVGQFVPRKGIMRLDEALKNIGDNRIKAIYIGSGSIVPQYENTLFKGRVPHDSLPEYLNAADCFVLPTDNEGCSNAIIEAMACGLPIISTDAPFNYDVLNENNSIMIDSQSVDAIADAVIKLRDDSVLRKRLGESALATAQRLSISRRAERIVEFMQERIKK